MHQDSNDYKLLSLTGDQTFRRRKTSRGHIVADISSRINRCKKSSHGQKVARTNGRMDKRLQ